MRSTGLPTRLRAILYALLAAAGLSACTPAGPDQAMMDGRDHCAPGEACQGADGLASRVRLDTDAILAGMAHARARLGLQEDATP